MLAVVSFLVLILAAPLRADSFWKNQMWTTPDGIKLVGLYHAAEKPSGLTWVLLHGLGSTKEEWDGFARKVAAQGAGVFIYDARGHGQSNQTMQGESLDYQKWLASGPGTP